MRGIIADNKVPISRVVVDSIGVGQGLVDLLNGCIPFKSNNRPLRDEGYGSLRDQCYYKLAELIQRGQIRIKLPAEQQQQVITELSAHKRISTQGGSGPARVSPKDEVSRAIRKSPDYADAMMMAMVPLVYQTNRFVADVIRF